MEKKFKRNLIVGYSISLLLLLVSSIASFISIRNLLENQDAVNHTNEVIKTLDDVIAVLRDAETGQRGFLITGKDAYLEPYNGGHERLTELVGQIKQLTADNANQQIAANQLNDIALTRMSILAELIEAKRRGEPLSESKFLAGKTKMDSARAIVHAMQQKEQVLLNDRTVTLNRFATSTPILIVAALGLAILVTIISFLRVSADFKRRQILQEELKNKNAEVNRRIHIIEKITSAIAAGSYSTRVAEQDKETLGVLAQSIDTMAGSLDKAFTEIEQREWLQTGVASLINELVVEKEIEPLTQNILELVAEYSGSQSGAFYLLTGNELELQSGYALAEAYNKRSLSLGVGLAGQCAQSGKILELNNLAPEDYVISYSAGSIKPKSIIAVPIFFNRTLKGVIELASLNGYSNNIKTYLEAVAYNIGIAINTTQNRQKVQELLEETQSQAEELQAQHSELENVNTELQAQAEKLQASDEELRVQQEELQQTNSELEERSRLLEEKNELVLERNLEIQRKAEELEMSTRYKSEFLANMSHELRTPLNSILLLSRLLSENHDSNLSGDQVEYARVIQSSGKGLLTLIDDILDLSKIESGKIELEYADVQLDAVIHDIKALFDPVAKDKGIQFFIECDPEVPEVLQTDKLRLEQIIRNLVSNALKFTKKGTVSLRITRIGDSISFSVQDTGIGIPKEKQQTIFEAFQQADGSTRREYGGTGLGLSISRELSRLLGGEIRLKSEEGQGSEFTLTLPVKKGQLVVEEKASPAYFPPSEVKINEPNSVISRDDRYTAAIIPAAVPDDRQVITAQDKVILIIEDDTAFAMSLLEYTRSQGYKGLVAVRGDEGIQLAKQFRPLGILLDVQLPVKSGWEVMEELKADKNTRPIPVHMMSSHHVAHRSLSTGAVDFINKPVAFEKLGEVFQKIKEAMNRHPKKVLIVEENTKHAQALAYFLQNYQVGVEISQTVGEGINELYRSEVDCVILDMGIPAHHSYKMLEDIKKTPGFEKLPIIIFTGKNLSHIEEMRIKQYADSIVVKTAHSYQRILDEVSLFLHLVDDNKQGSQTSRYKKLGEAAEVLKGKTVLIADDDVRNIFSLTRSLENYGVNVISAMDGKDALKQLDENTNVDLVLMDMMMPEMDGYESTKRIRAIPRFRNLPIIAVTAKAMTGDREKCINAGASDYITKPVDLDQLTSLLRVWLYE